MQRLRSEHQPPAAAQHWLLCHMHSHQIKQCNCPPRCQNSNLAHAIVMSRTAEEGHISRHTGSELNGSAVAVADQWVDPPASNETIQALSARVCGSPAVDG